MNDLIVVLLIAFVILLIVQIVALIRVRQLINRLRHLLVDLSRLQRKEDFTLPKQLRICQFCKYRKTYIKANISGNKENFYYRCSFHDKNVNLSSSCKEFQFDNGK